MMRRGKPELVLLLTISHIFVVELDPEKSGLEFVRPPIQDTLHRVLSRLMSENRIEQITFDCQTLCLRNRLLGAGRRRLASRCDSAIVSI